VIALAVGPRVRLSLTKARQRLWAFASLRVARTLPSEKRGQACHTLSTTVAVV
jgi:hypothetical protein